VDPVGDLTPQAAQIAGAIAEETGQQPGIPVSSRETEKNSSSAPSAAENLS
jgi:hypothetical protein